ncbi:DUF2625 family protein [Persicobacter psychrovividus]|uniref:DUF2625 domain-containing protein n=1 Tax=Persicobacter psychrovividus TaxID=387638 RepID=A0ABM7VMA0_9BACT|nr:hypothetical protein PEPS_43910 [Persicobacter psychrovividus]
MRKSIFTFILLASLNITANGQQQTLRPLRDLINTMDPGWAIIEGWLKTAKNDIKILPKEQIKADSALYYTQVTSRSLMGAIIYESGGILVDNGWLRILGSGSKELNRSLPEWNKGKSFENYGQAPAFLLIADDVIGGMYAINGGAFGMATRGKVYYFSPQHLKWECINMSYSEFIHWAFHQDLNEVYEELRWSDWKTEVKSISGNRVMFFYPFLFSAYDNIDGLNRKTVPINETWQFYMKQTKQ